MPYTYLIGWSEHKKYYYGVRFAKDCDPSDLWKTYFTSSKHVKSFRELHGEPDIIDIRKVFTSGKQARLWEEKVLRKMNVIKDSRFLNKNVNGKFLKEGPQDKVHIKKRIDATVKTRKGNGSFHISESHKSKLSAASKGVPKPFSEEHAKSIKKRLQKFNSLKVKCPHCSKSGQYTNMKRWHFDNCKLIPQ